MSGVVDVVLTAVGRRVELVRAFRRAYEALGVEGRIVGLDVDPLAPGLQEVDVPIRCPRTGTAEWEEMLFELCDRPGEVLIFPLIDPDVTALAGLRSSLEEAGGRPLVVPAEAAGTISDKWLTYRFFEDLGVRTAWTVAADDVDVDGLEFPVFLKPRRGSASQGVHRIDDAEELRFWTRRVEDPVVQEFLPGPEITTDVVMDFEGRPLGAVSRRRIEVRGGEVSKGTTVLRPGLLEACVDVARALGAVGPVTVQAIMKDDEPCFTEVNGRFGGGCPLGFAAGVDGPRWLLALAAGLKPELPALGAYDTDLYLTRYDESFFMTEEAISRDDPRRAPSGQALR